MSHGNVTMVWWWAYSLRRITFTMLSTFQGASRLDQVSPHSANWPQTLPHRVQFDPELEWPRGNWSEWGLAPRLTNLATDPAKSNISAEVILPSTFHAWFLVLKCFPVIFLMAFQSLCEINLSASIAHMPRPSPPWFREPRCRCTHLKGRSEQP